MTQNAIRSAGLFVATGALLFGIVVGSLLLAKDRNAAYFATPQSSPSNVTRVTSGKTPPSQQQQHVSSIASPGQSSQGTGIPSQQTTPAPVAATLSSTPAPPANSAGIHDVPATGPSITDHLITGVLMMCAAYLSLYLVRARIANRF